MRNALVNILCAAFGLVIGFLISGLAVGAVAMPPPCQSHHREPVPCSQVDYPAQGEARWVVYVGAQRDCPPRALAECVVKD